MGKRPHRPCLGCTTAQREAMAWRLLFHTNAPCGREECVHMDGVASSTFKPMKRNPTDGEEEGGEAQVRRHVAAECSEARLDACDGWQRHTGALI